MPSKTIKGHFVKVRAGYPVVITVYLFLKMGCPNKYSVPHSEGLPNNLTLLLKFSYKTWKGTSLVVQWLRLHAPNAGDMGLIPGQGTKIPQAKKRKNKQMNKKPHKYL